MIIDAHCHLFWEDSDPAVFFEGCARAGARLFSKLTPEPADATQLLATQMELLSDPTGDKLIELMQSAGIDKTLLLPLDFWYWAERAGHSGPYDINKKNQQYFDVTQKYEGRLYSLFGIDPRRKASVSAFEKAVTNWGMIGLKLHPTARFYPDDEVCYPMYEKAIELGVPVVFHSGNEPAPMAAKYSHPKYIDTVAADFPDLKIVVAHIGHGWWRQTLDFAVMKPNLYVDFSGWQTIQRVNPQHMAHVLRTAIDLLGPWRVLFGSDGSMLNIIMPLNEWTNAIKNLETLNDPKFTKDELEIIMGKAAQHLFAI